jgi:hypothetical protein
MANDSHRKYDLYYELCKLVTQACGMLFYEDHAYLQPRRLFRTGMHNRQGNPHRSSGMVMGRNRLLGDDENITAPYLCDD